MQDGMTIGEVAHTLGMTAHTLRYYERAGLLPAVPRTDGGLRRYQDNDVELLRFLARLRLTGMPIRQVRKYSELVRQGDSTMGQRREMMEKHRKDMQDRIAQLQRNVEILDLKINLYENGWVHKDSLPNPCAEKLRSLLQEKG
jgi:DNA-binding transcriptional MerR regulator